MLPMDIRFTVNIPPMALAFCTPSKIRLIARPISVGVKIVHTAETARQINVKIIFPFCFIKSLKKRFNVPLIFCARSAVIPSPRESVLFCTSIAPFSSIMPIPPHSSVTWLSADKPGSSQVILYVYPCRRSFLHPTQ